MAATLLNVPGLGWTDASGNPLSGGKIYIYQAGTIDTVKASYPTRDDATAQSNANTHPVVLDSAGRPPADIWVDGRYKAVVTDAADLVIATVDDLGGTDSDDLIPRDYVGGLAVTVSGGDAEHDFVVAAGEARDDADSDDMVLVSSLTKQVDVVWAAGSNAGALDTGTVAAGTDYYIYLIKSSGTGAVDVLLSASASAPTMPSGYDKKQLIARLVTDASANISAVYGRDWTVAGIAFSKGSLSGVLSADIAAISGLRRINGLGSWGHRNVVINGGMEVCQRETSIAGLGGGGQTSFQVDRWGIQDAGSASARWTLSQESGGGVDGKSMWFKAWCQTADPTPSGVESQRIATAIEGRNARSLVDASNKLQEFTLSLDIILHAAGASGITFPATVPLTVFTEDGTARSYVKDVTIDAAVTWQRVSITVPADATAQIDNDNGLALRLGVGLYAATAASDGVWANLANNFATVNSENIGDATGNYVGITNVQAEPGPAATDFECVPYDVEFARCRRYFRKIIDVQGGGDYIADGMAISAGGAYFHFPLDPPMRDTPSGEFIQGDATALDMQSETANPIVSVTDFGHVVGEGGPSLAVLYAVASSLTVFEAVHLRADGSTGAGFKFGLSAET